MSSVRSIRHRMTTNRNYYSIVVIVVIVVQAIWIMSRQNQELQMIIKKRQQQTPKLQTQKIKDQLLQNATQLLLLLSSNRMEKEESSNTPQQTITKTTTVSSNQQTTTTTEEKMNVLLLYADDWRFDTLGVAGNPIVQTPVLDQLAKEEGMRFTENCVTTSVCWCSRATLWTGLYTARHKTFRPRDISGIVWNETLYAQFQQNHYHVGHVGKWGVWHNYGSTLPYNMPAEGWHKRTFGETEIHITEKNTADSLRFLRERPKTKPFLLVTSYLASA